MICCTLVTTSLLAACGHTSVAPYTGLVVESSIERVASCKLLDSLSGSSGLTGFFAPKGVDNVKQSLLRQADAIGATHVVWDKPIVGYESTDVRGKAYLCPKAAPTAP